jgi:hypothetical protein
VAFALAAAASVWTLLLGTLLFKLLVVTLIGTGFVLGLWLTRPQFPRRTTLIVASMMLLVTPPFFFIYRAGAQFWTPLAFFVAALVMLGFSLGNIASLYRRRANTNPAGTGD